MYTHVHTKSCSWGVKKQVIPTLLSATHSIPDELRRKKPAQLAENARFVLIYNLYGVQYGRHGAKNCAVWVSSLFLLSFWNYFQILCECTIRFLTTSKCTANKHQICVHSSNKDCYSTPTLANLLPLLSYAFLRQT